MSIIKQATHFAYAQGKKDWSKDTYADFGGDVGKVFDHQIARYAMQHLGFFDRFNIRKVVAAAMYSFAILSKSVEEPNVGKDNWKFFRDV